jgi:hypothetical protein
MAGRCLIHRGVSHGGRRRLIAATPSTPTMAEAGASVVEAAGPPPRAARRASTRDCRRGAGKMRLEIPAPFSGSWPRCAGAHRARRAAGGWTRNSSTASHSPR